VATPLTTPAAVTAALLRPLTPNETASIEDLILQASSRLRTKLPSVDDRIALWSTDPRPINALDPEVVKSVLAGVIKRYMANPEGAASKSRSAGPYSQTTSFASYGKAIGSEGKLRITDDDLADLVSGGYARPGSIKLQAALAPAHLEPGGW